MIYCIEKSSSWLYKKPFDYDTAFDSGRTRMIVKYVGDFIYKDLFHYLYIDLASGGYFMAASTLEESSTMCNIVWRLE